MSVATGRFTPRLAYRDVRPYTVDPTPCDLELADNTPPFGTPPAAQRVLASSTHLDLTRYPTTYSAPLRAAIAAYIGVAAEEVMVGAGSDELLSCTFRALAEPGQRLAYMHPTFIMTPVFAQTNSLTPLPVPLTTAFDADADALVDSRAEITYLCAPNNPTGTPVATATLERVLREAPGLVMVDEAYAEFAGTNLAATAPHRDGMLAYRTFSKAFGLAGARVGYVVAHRTLVRELEKARGPYTVSMVSEQCAAAVLAADLAWVRVRVHETLEVRDWFGESLRGLGFAPLPSAANFVLLPVPEAAQLASALLARGIRVRPFPALPHLGDALRITIGQRPAMERVLEALQEAMAHLA